MSRIAQIQDKFRLICDQNTSVRTFLFDDASSLNAVHDNYYPAVLLKIPQKSNIPDYNKNWEQFDLEFYVLESRWQSETRSLAEQHDALKVIAEDIIDEFKFYPTVYQVLGGVDFEYGYDTDVNNSVAVRVKFRANVFNCRDNTASGEVVTITDNDNALVGTVATRSSLQVIAKDQNNVEIDCTYTLANGILTLSGINVSSITMEKFINVNQTLTHASFVGKSLDDMLVQGNGGEWTTLNEGTEATLVGDTITLSQDFGGTGIFKVLIVA